MIEQFAPIIVAALVGSLYVYRSDFQRYSIGTVGVFKRFERSSVTGGDMDSVDMQCIECEKDLVTAERRRYWKEIVVFGAAVWQREVGESYYCEDHVSFELRNGLDDATHIHAERLPMGILTAIVKFATWSHELDIEDDLTFQKASNTIESVLPIFTMLPLVLFIAAAVSLVEATFSSSSS